MSKSNNDLQYSIINFKDDILSTGRTKIKQINDFCKLHNLNFIKTQGTFLYHVRQLDEKDEKFKYPKWFVFRPEDLLVILVYRMWQNNDHNNYNINPIKLDYYKKNLYVDVYYIKNNINLIKFPRNNYQNLEKFMYQIDNNYKPSFDDSNNFEIADWFFNNKNILPIDGWFEESNDKLRIQKFANIDEIMILPSSRVKLDLVCSERIDRILDFSNIKFIK